MEKGSMSSTRMRNWNMNKLIPLSLAAVFALTSGFTPSRSLPRPNNDASSFP